VVKQLQQLARRLHIYHTDHILDATKAGTLQLTASYMAGAPVAQLQTLAGALVAAKSHAEQGNVPGVSAAACWHEATQHAV
jgi:hypothetical protein